jgi:trimeric autotransporter adhesin
MKLQNRSIVSLGIVLVGLFISSGAFGQVTKTAKTGIKNWGTSGSWACAPNPCNGIPAAGEHVVIPANATVNLNVSATPNLLSVTIQTGGTLIVQGSNSITLSRNFSNNGSFIAGLGVVTFSGTAGVTQIINGTSVTIFNNITVNNGGAAIDVQVTSPQQLTGVLTVNSTARFDVTGSGNFTLLSLNDDPVADASIASLAAGGSVTGNITVQRYISQENRVYRYISTPVSNTSVSDWQDDFAITGNFSGASTSDPETGETTICGLAVRAATPSMYVYNESVAGVQDNGWVAYAGGSIQTGRGYAPFIRESCYREVIIDVTGTINQGNISLPVSYTNSGTPDGDGWNLVGNPYPSAIRWNSNGNGWSIGNDISTSVQVRDNISGNFIPIIYGGEIAQGQAFWVKANGPSASLTIQESAKVLAAASTAFYRVSSSHYDNLKLKLSNGSITDVAYFRMLEGASSDYEKHDLIKWNNDSFDLSFLAAGNRQLAVNSVGSIECGEKIQIHIKDVKNGTYTLQVEREGIFSGFDVLLHDKFANTSVNIAELAYTFQVNDNASSKASNRFEIELAMVTSPSVVAGIICNEGSATLVASGSGANYKWYAQADGTSIYQGASFETPVLTESTTYFVSKINSQGCEGPKVPVEVTVVHNPSAEIRVGPLNQLVSNSTSGNQWFYNGMLLEGETNQTLLAKNSGTYSVEVNIGECTSTAVKEYRMVYVTDGKPLAVFPNPIINNGLVTVQVLAQKVGPAQLISSRGDIAAEFVLIESEGNIWSATLDMNAYPKGMYMVRIVRDNIPDVIKVMNAK